jgi:carbon monoxide dehydrogenase subunit G
MSTFKSSVTINQPAGKIYQFLADMNNHQQLILTGDISDWSSTTDTASFNVRNMVKLSLKVADRIPDTEIRIIPAEKPPFDIGLEWRLLADGNSTKVDFTITAELNMMMKMLASGPLQNLADEETKSLYNLMNG